MKPKNLLVIVNPFSGKGISNKVYPQFKKFLLDADITFFPYQTTGKDDLGTLRRLLDSTEFDQVSVLGGDGTINLAINAIADRDMKLHLIPCGMGNDLYRTLHGSIPRNLQFKKVLSQDRRVVDVFSCNGLRFSVAFGVGFDGQVTYYVARLRNKRIPRLLSYWVSVLMNLRSFKEVQLETSFGTFDTFLLSISNTPYVGGGFKIAPEAIIDDRLVDMIHIGKISFLGRISNLLKVRTGKHLGIAEVSHQKISAIKIQCDRELYAHLDGELIQSKSYDIRFARKLEFLV